MIRVNLLATSPGTATPRVWVPTEQRSAILGLALLMVTAAGIGGWWWYLDHQRASAEAGIANAETKLEQLKEAVKVLDQATARKSELSERLGLIDRLRDAKRAPVNLLETVSRAVPDGLWLMEIKQQGAAVQIEGRAVSLTSVTDFAETMQRSGLFKMPVEILTTSTELVDEATVVRFAVRAEAITAAAPVTPAAPGPAATRPPTTPTTAPALPATAPSGRPGV